MRVLLLTGPGGDAQGGGDLGVGHDRDRPLSQESKEQNRPAVEYHDFGDLMARGCRLGDKAGQPLEHRRCPLKSPLPAGHQFAFRIKYIPCLNRFDRHDAFHWIRRARHP